MRIGRLAVGIFFPFPASPVHRALVLLLASCGSAALAETGYYVTPDGRRHPMIRSETELAVFVQEVGKASSAAKRLAKSTLGRLDRFEHFPSGRVFRLTTDKTSPKRFAEVLSDPDVIGVRPVYRFGDDEVPVIVTGRIALRLRPNVSEQERDALFSEHALGIVQDGKPLAGVYLVQPLVFEESIKIAERLAYDGRIAWATPNLIRPTVGLQVSFSDEFFADQWHHQNLGEGGGLIDADIDTPEAWEVSTGAGVLIGMIDEGVDVDHEDLSERYIGTGRDLTKPGFQEGGDDPRPALDTEAHGTAVAGLMVASANSVGVRGVAPSALFTAARGIGVGPVEDFELAIEFQRAALSGVDVHNNSWGFVGRVSNPPVIVDGIRFAFEEGRDGLGTVVLFAAGNDNALNETGFDLSTLDEVIGIGASDRSDRRSSFSNFGPDIDILAPGGTIAGDVVTTDNTDSCCWFDELGERTDDPEQRVTAAWGYNREGRSRIPEFGLETGTDIDPTGSVTGTFNGTSAASPIASGVAALVLSINPNLTAKQVRSLMQHSTDRVSQDVARYDPISGHSLEYAYGRINAHKAVLAAQESISNGGFTWPDLATGVSIAGSTMSWTVGSGSNDFLLVQSENEFEFRPEDGVCYDQNQAGCEAAPVVELPENVSLLAHGCEDACADGDVQELVIDRPEIGSRTAAIYARNSVTGRYSFGRRVRIEAARAPSIVINVSPLSGDSPLTVTFQGNAVSELEIDDSRTSWDFDTSDGIGTDSTERTTTHTYTVGAGIERVFTARLTMFDIEGNDGIAEILIRVQGPSVQSVGGEGGPTDLRVVAGRPGSPGSDINGGTSPLNVELSLKASGFTGALQGVSWDLGDGERATGLVIAHTYFNGSDDTVRVPVTATVRTTTEEGQTVQTVAFKVLDVEPGDDANDTEVPQLPGTTPIGGVSNPFGLCGAAGLIPLAFAALFLSLLRRHRRPR